MLAVATAATGAITVGGAAATTATPFNASSLTEQVLVQRSVLDAMAAAEALRLRSEENAARSFQRARLGEAASLRTAMAAEQAAADLAAVDALAVERASRVPAAVAPVWVIPVEGYKLTSLYGQRWGKLHAGVDLAAPIGTPIRAMSDGEIVEAAGSGGYGQRTIIRHTDGTEIWYCHQSAFEVTSGTVTAGQVIGYIGSTGNSTGPHLHLEVHPGGGDAIDPSPWISTVGLAF